MTSIKSTNEKQKEILAQFYSNFALAWITFGVIAPVFSKIDNLQRLVFGMIISLVMTMISLHVALRFVK